MIRSGAKLRHNFAPTTVNAAPMPRFMLRIRDDNDTVMDPETVDLPDLEEARAAALDVIQDLWVRRPSRVTKDMMFQVVDETGQVVLTVPFAH
jgi:hypothetical protein